MIASPTPNQFERAVTGDWRVASALRYFLRSRGAGRACIRPLNLVVRPLLDAYENDRSRFC